MNRIENTKTYLGKELETIFFRPMFEGESAIDLGVRVLYNMPSPVTLHFWRRPDDVLHKYTNAGWKGSTSPERMRKNIELQRVKAEIGYSADEYFSLVYDSMTRAAIGSMEDLTGTVLEAAETALFREAIAESIRATMWLGKSDREDGLNTFDGFLYRIQSDISSQRIPAEAYDAIDASTAETRLKTVWNNASAVLKDLRSEGQLAFFVTSDVYAAYEESLETPTLEAAYMAKQTGHTSLTYRGVPLVDLKLNDHMMNHLDLGKSFILLTDRRNLALALSAGEFPGTEVRMWYNPDLMENRQRAIFMAGCDYLLPELISLAMIE